jgi:dephospho-CoA kinase
MITGITGGFGCGKSTVLVLFQEYGATVFSADRFCHEIYEEKNPMLLKKISGYFGNDAVDSNGNINRKLIAQRVFSCPADMDFLNSVLAVPLKEKILSAISDAANSDYLYAIEIPLLFEEHYETMLDKTITVAAPDEARIRFLAQRGFDAAEMQKRDACQMPLSEKIKLADYVIINGSDEEFLKEQFLNIWKDLTR